MLMGGLMFISLGRGVLLERDSAKVTASTKSSNQVHSGAMVEGLGRCGG